MQCAVCSHQWKTTLSTWEASTSDDAQQLCVVTVAVTMHSEAPQQGSTAHRSGSVAFRC